jgi:hypothetical protein
MLLSNNCNKAVLAVHTYLLIMDVRMIAGIDKWPRGSWELSKHSTTEPQENHDNSFLMTVQRQVIEQRYWRGKAVSYLISPHPTSPCPYQVNN